jgi:hypothetical protein
MIDFITGPAGGLFALAVVGLLAVREFLKLRSGTPIRRRITLGSVLTCCAGIVAFAVIALRVAAS